jgi:hypothetical protein
MTFDAATEPEPHVTLSLVVQRALEARPYRAVDMKIRNLTTRPAKICPRCD